MSLQFLGVDNTPTYMALSTDIEDNRIEGASKIGKTVYLTDTEVWKIILGDLTLGNYSQGNTSNLSHAYLGATSEGLLNEVMVSKKVYAKKISVVRDCLLSSIDVFIDSGESLEQARDISIAVYSDNNGTPDVIISKNVNMTVSTVITSAGGITTARWLSTSSGLFLPSGDYWIAVTSLSDLSSAFRIYYDNGGADKTYNSSGSWIADWGFYTPSNTTKNYSIRASIIF